METDRSTDVIVALLAVMLVVMVAVGSLYFYEEPIRKFEETQTMMDTFVTVTIYGNDEQESLDAIGAAFEEMKRVVAIASTWNSSAEAYQLNQDKVLSNPSMELVELIEVSQRFCILTDGCFDITVQPLLDLWSYDPAAEQQMWELNYSEQVEKINAVMSFVGSDLIQVSDSPSQIVLSEANMSITLGGIAKGYVVDCGLQVLENSGVSYALINAGGDIATLGSKPEGPWLVALENPENRTEYITRFKVEGKAVATSGNYIRYFKESANVGHILNPKTGFSADECWSVAIIADNCTYADSLATGVFVLGPVEGMDLINGLDDVEGLIIDASGVIVRSNGLESYEY